MMKIAPPSEVKRLAATQLYINGEFQPGSEYTQAKRVTVGLERFKSRFEV